MNELSSSFLIDLLTMDERRFLPKALYYFGDPNLMMKGPKVAVVGSRAASTDGLKRAEIISKRLVEAGIIVVSGLAKGIDTVAHKTAIKYGGKTISILGSPLDNCYPKENSNLLKDITSSHLAISQFPSGYPILPRNFPLRNKTMALISDATIIIEAGATSGTKHQGWEAIKLNRRVLILENVVKQNILWVNEMLEYGARILSKENLEEEIDLVPNYITPLAELHDLF